MSIERQPEQSDLSRIGRALLRRAWVIVVCLILAIGAAVLMTVLAQKEYEGTAALLSRATTAEEPQRVVDTNLQLLSLPAVAERTAILVPELNREQVSTAIETKQQGESDVILVTATASDPEQAAELANTFARQFIAFSRGKEESQQTGRTELVDRATPNDTPVSPKPVKNIVFGALVGLVLGIAVALLFEQFDRRLRRREDIAEVTGLPLLASLPRRQAFDPRHLGKEPLPATELEPLRMVRAQLKYFHGRRDVRSVVVTSAQPGEGKTVVSLGLALAAVTSGERVLLIEADMRDPVLAGIFKLESRPGLTELLTDEHVSLDDALQRLETASVTDDLVGRNLDVIVAGAVPPNPTELGASKEMGNLLAAATRTYDLVVVDTPPALTVSDALPLIAAADGVLPVSGIGVSTRNSAADLVTLLEGTGTPVVGLIANFSEPPDPARQAYGYGRPPELELPNVLRDNDRPAREGDAETQQS